MKPRKQLERILEEPTSRTNSELTHKPYPTDLSDEQWENIQPWLSEAKPTGRCHQTVNQTEVVNVIRYWSRCSVKRELLPQDLPPAKIVYCYFSRWQKNGVWQQIHHSLQQRASCHREEQQSTGIIDISLDASRVCVRVACPLDLATSEEFAPLEEADCGDFVETTAVEGGERGIDGDTDFNGVRTRPLVLQKDNERKRPIIIDALSLVLVFLIYVANVADVTHGSENGCGKSFFRSIECALTVSRAR